MANKSNKKTLDANKKFLSTHLYALVAVLGFYILGRFVWAYGTVTTWTYVQLVLSSCCEVALYLQFRSIATPAYGPTGELLHGGDDLTNPGLIEYMRDVLYVTMACQVLAVFSDSAWWLWAVIPVFALYQGWTQLLQPYLASRSAGGGDAGGPVGNRRERRQQGREKAR
eukprot:comp10823_c0_seq1/m.5454 comp10823_c0_seq1/g.5454  ORF comp10823_c0_seq1/g.5454 comp10823_c0_seq1/m.5454 type:complete len:169 (-) comp10823_c0_seq1:14-520(-)